jgi:hypothetical protein
MIFRLTLIIFLYAPAFAQTGANSVLLLKKGEKTISKYFSGNSIAFSTKDGMQVSGVISRITLDSIFLINYNIRRLQRADGGIIFDTASRYNLMFSLGNIGSFPVYKQKGKNILTDGSLLMLGGGAYLVLNIFNTTREGNPPFGEENLPNVLWATGAVATGFLIKKLWPKKMVIGHKYYIKILEG